MKAGTPGVVHSVEATEALTEKRFVTFDGKHTLNEKALGVSLAAADNTEMCPVAVTGIVPVICGGTVTAKGAVASTADGKAVDAGANPVCGYALSDGADGDEILVKLI